MPPDDPMPRAGFEMRWWSPAGDHLGASLFVFPDNRSAEEYVSEASSTRCRGVVVSATVSQPWGARALAWENPDGYLQADVYFARGMSSTAWQRSARALRASVPLAPTSRRC